MPCSPALPRPQGEAEAHTHARKHAAAKPPPPPPTHPRLTPRSSTFTPSQTLYYDVDPFLFYVLCEEMPGGEQHIAGYFSRRRAAQVCVHKSSQAQPSQPTATAKATAKRSHSSAVHLPHLPPPSLLVSSACVRAEGNNIACILVLPPHQRKEYGKLLIDLAYNITMREVTQRTPTHLRLHTPHALAHATTPLHSRTRHPTPHTRTPQPLLTTLHLTHSPSPLPPRPSCPTTG